MAELLALRLDKFKDQLVSAPPEHFLRLQGQAQAVKKLLDDVTGTSPVLTE